MPSLDARRLDETFRGKMMADWDDNSDHKRFSWRVDDRVVLTTELSTPVRGTLSAKLIASIARHELHLPNGASDLAELVNCTFSAEAWAQHVDTYGRAQSRWIPRR